MDPIETSVRDSLARAGRPRLSRALRAVVYAVALIVVLFMIYDVVERTWLSNLSMEELHRFHQVRGIAAAVLAASLASWLILRASPPLFVGGEVVQPARDHALPPSAEERERRFARWFILMRWIAVVVAGVLVFVSIGVMGYLPEEVFPPLLSLIVALVVLNLTYLAALHAGFPTRQLLLLQAYGDLLVLTGLLHFSGGLENPLATLMLLHVIIAGIVLSRRQCYLVAAGASALFALMAWGEWSGTLGHYTLTVFPHAEADGEHLHAALDAEYVLSRLGLQVVLLFLTAYFTTTVTAQLQRREFQLERLADDALAQSQLLERALDSTGTALCVCDGELRQSWANPRWAELLGPNGRGRLGLAGERRARRTLEDGSVHVGEVELAASSEQDGGADPRTILVTTAPLLDKQSRVTHVVELARDVSDLRRIQERVGRAEQLAAVGELAGKVAHEVNNPIAVISAKTRLLLSRYGDELSERTVEELVKITELSDKVAHIARGLLAYSRPSHGAAAPTDVRVPLRRALSMIETAADTRGVEVVDAIPESLPPVHVNATEVEQVFVNLFMNALDAMPEGGRLTIAAALEAAPDERELFARVDGGARLEHTRSDLGVSPTMLSVVVEDTGTGIPRELQKQVFEPFLTTKPEGKGTGLGLPICLGLVRSQGGSIDLESEPGRGTRVIVRLPVHDTALHDRPAHA